MLPARERVSFCFNERLNKFEIRAECQLSIFSLIGVLVNLTLLVSSFLVVLQRFDCLLVPLLKDILQALIVSMTVSVNNVFFIFLRESFAGPEENA